MIMADPEAIVPYDPFDDDTQCIDMADIIRFEQSPILNFPDLPSAEEEPNSFNRSIIPPSHDDDAIVETDDLILDPVVWDMFNLNHGNSQPSTSEFPGERTHEREIPQPQNSEFGNPVQLSIWPVPPIPYSCTCCQVLREIIHTNGIYTTKLEIHGRLGLISHAILESRYGNLITTQNQYQMLDFCKKSIESVKEFLVQYCEGRRQDGYTMLQDPLLIFYEALCVGLNGDNSLDTDDFLQYSPTDSAGEYQVNQPQPQPQPQPMDQGGPVNQPWAVSEEMRFTRSTLAEQVARERTGRLTLKDLVKYFHLPIENAAKELNVCLTVVKKICRRHGLERWPYRKIKSIERKISEKRARLTASDAEEEREAAQAEIKKYERELAQLFAAFNKYL